MPQHPQYMPPILGIDPGKQGGFCLMSGDGIKHKFWEMPLTGNKVCGVGIARIYRDVASICREAPRVFIEKPFTKPSDHDEGSLLIEVSCAASETIDLNNKTQVSFQPTGDEVTITYKKGKRDGRVGTASYFKGCALLHMCVLWEWSVVEVSPRTWCARMHAGIDGKLPPKEKSRVYISQHWPELYQKGSVIWPGRAQKPHEGLQDALMIAEWRRRYG